LFKNLTCYKSVYWTIDVEIQYYLLSIPIVLVLKKYNYIVWLVSVTAVIYIIQHYFLLGTYLYWHNIFRWFPMFALGLIACCYMLGRIGPVSMLILSLFLIGLILIEFKPQENLDAVLPLVL